MSVKHEGEREYLIATDEKYLWGTTLMYKDSAIKRYNRILENYPSVDGHLFICRLADVTEEVINGKETV